MQKVKSIAKVFVTILLALTIGMGVVTGLDTPVAEEGQELNKAQQFLVWLQEKSNEILTTLGVSSDVVLGYLLVAQRRLDGENNTKLDDVSSEVAEIKKSVSSIAEEVNSQQTINGKIDALLDVIEASELPAEQRAKLKSAREIGTKIVEASKTLDLGEQIKAVVESLKANEQVNKEEETAETTPSFFG